MCEQPSNAIYWQKSYSEIHLGGKKLTGCCPSKLEILATRLELTTWVMYSFPPTVETFLCFDRHIVDGYNAYAIERGSHERIKRKEVRYDDYACTTSIQTNACSPGMIH